MRKVPDRFAVAFSFAGEARQLVLPIAQEVEAILGPSTVFYDDWFEHWIAGADGDLLLQDLYGTKADLVVVCVTGAYVEKPWTRTEHRAIRARLMHQGDGADRARVLMVRVGEGDIPGILINEIVPDIRSRTPAEAAELIISRLNLARGAADAVPLDDVPQWPGQPPELLWPMADHVLARSAFAELLSDTSPARALLVRGGSETGKTHMSMQMTRNAQALPGVRCGRFDFKGTTNIDVEIEALAQPLGIDSPSAQALHQRLATIFTELRRQARPTVLIFDTYEAAGGAKDWVEGVLLPHLVSAGWLRVVVIGQTVPVRIGKTWESLASKTLTLQMPGPEHWFEYGRANRGDSVELSFVTQAHELTDGKASILAGLFGPQP